ncbi:MAG TPA: DUF4142 domain-containing protein [Oscillatoriaceae cyanobacterium]
MRKMDRLYATLALLAVGSGMCAMSTPAWAAKASTTTAADRQFVIDAALGDMAEVKLGRLADKHSHTPAVRAFAERMIHDHGQNLDKVKTLAKTLGVTLPKETSSELNGVAEQLEKLKGKAFDRAYLDSMIADHTKDVDDFRKETKEAHAPKVKAFARETLPVLEEHLRMAKSARGKV